MYGSPRSNEALFSPDLIGEALARIVSEFEGQKYIYASLKVYEHGWRQGTGIYINNFHTKAIVRQELSEYSFCLNDDSPWRLAKLAHILECTRHWTSDIINYDIPVSFIDEFSSQNCFFPYLNDFLNILENTKKEKGEVTKEMVMALANDFSSKQTGGNKVKRIKP